VLPALPATLIVPLINTSPVVKIVTGVLEAFGVKVTVTPVGMLIVVKLNTPEGGTWSVVLVLGFSAPSAPVLPLLKAACAGRADIQTKQATMSVMKIALTFIEILLGFKIPLSCPIFLRLHLHTDIGSDGRIRNGLHKHPQKARDGLGWNRFDIDAHGKLGKGLGLLKLNEDPHGRGLGHDRFIG
jgi:hypothetical protein